MREHDMMGMTTSVSGWNALKQTLVDYGGMLLALFLPALIVSLVLLSAVFRIATTEEGRYKTYTVAKIVAFSIAPSNSYTSTITYKNEVYETSYAAKKAQFTPEIAYTTLLFILFAPISPWLPALFTIAFAKIIKIISNEMRRDKHIQGVGDVLDIETDGVKEHNTRMSRKLRGKKRVPGRFLSLCARHFR